MYEQPLRAGALARKIAVFERTRRPRFKLDVNGFGDGVFVFKHFVCIRPYSFMFVSHSFHIRPALQYF